jgi:hypothetical protein
MPSSRAIAAAATPWFVLFTVKTHWPAVHCGSHGHTVIHICGAFSFWKAEEEASVLQPLLIVARLLPRGLEVAPILLPQLHLFLEPHKLLATPAAQAAAAAVAAAKINVQALMQQANCSLKRI